MAAPAANGTDPDVDALLVAIVSRLQAVCLGAGVTVATAESCTGGHVAHTITRVPGSSGYFVGGVVAYADRAKVELLGVPNEIIAAHGAVSAQVARAMADGARARLRVDLAVAVTGVAGPDGGTPTKPVGLTYIATAGPDGSDVRRFTWTGDRAANVVDSVRAALEQLVARAEALTIGRSSSPASGEGTG
jgi:PncC family amidohydrolase